MLEDTLCPLKSMFWYCLFTYTVVFIMQWHEARSGLHCVFIWKLNTGKVQWSKTNKTYISNLFLSPFLKAGSLLTKLALLLSVTGRLWVSANGSAWLRCICREILHFQSSIRLLAPALVAHLPHDALTNLAYPSLAANVFSEGQIRPVTYEIYFPPHLTLLVMSWLME